MQGDLPSLLVVLELLHHPCTMLEWDTLPVIWDRTILAWNVLPEWEVEAAQEHVAPLAHCD